MYDRKTVSLEVAKIGVEAAIKEASKIPDKPMAVAVVDDRGELICFERMDGAQKLFGDMAFRKALTAAQFRRDLREFYEHLIEIEVSLSDAWGSPYTMIPGGLPIAKDGTLPFSMDIYGAIGASGRYMDEDELIAKAGLKAMQKVLWPSE